MQGTN